MGIGETGSRGTPADGGGGSRRNDDGQRSALERRLEQNHASAIKADQDDGDDGDLTNEQVRRLVMSSLLAGDLVAADELYAFLLRKAYPRARSVPAHLSDEVRDVVVEAGTRAAAAVTHKHIDKPRNYIGRAMTTAFVSWLRKQKTTPARADADVGDLPSDDNDEAEVVCREALKGLRRLCKSPLDHKVADVIQVTYLLAVDEHEACVLLSYGKKEKAAVMKGLQRRRADTGSFLWRLGENEGVR